MAGIDVSTKVSLGNIDFNTGVADASGLVWWSEVQGIGPPPSRPTVLPLETVDGEAFTGGTLGPAELTLRGYVVGPTLASLYEARRRWSLMASQMVDALAPLTLIENAPAALPAACAGSSVIVPSRILVYRAEKPDWEVVVCAPHECKAIARFQLGLHAPDPRRLSTVEKTWALTSVAQSIVNAGNYRSDPIVTLIGAGGPTHTITNRGQSVILTTTLAGGAVCVVDFGQRTITINGVDSFGVLSPGSTWWSLDAGENLLSRNAASVETDASGWNANTNCTVARSTAEALHGVSSLAMTSVAAGQMVALNAGFLPVTTGVQYTVIVWFRAKASGRSCDIQLNWFTAGGSPISSAVSGAVTDSSSGWTKATITATAPITATQANFMPRVAATAAAGEVHYIDQMSMAFGSNTEWVPGSANLVSVSGPASASIAYRDAYL